jgi:hypothetical protein
MPKRAEKKKCEGAAIRRFSVLWNQQHGGGYTGCAALRNCAVWLGLDAIPLRLPVRESFGFESGCSAYDVPAPRRAKSRKLVKFTEKKKCEVAAIRRFSVL